MLRKLCPPRRARVFDDDFRQSELRSCNFMIEPLNQDHRDYMGTLTAVPTNSFKFAGVSGHGGKPNAYEPIRLQDLGI